MSKPEAPDVPEGKALELKPEDSLLIFRVREDDTVDVEFLRSQSANRARTLAAMVFSIVGDDPFAQMVQEHIAKHIAMGMTGFTGEGRTLH